MEGACHAVRSAAHARTAVPRHTRPLCSEGKRVKWARGVGHFPGPEHRQLHTPHTASRERSPRSRAQAAAHTAHSQPRERRTFLDLAPFAAAGLTLRVYRYYHTTSHTDVRDVQLYTVHGCDSGCGTRGVVCLECVAVGCRGLRLVVESRRGTPNIYFHCRRKREAHP